MHNLCWGCFSNYHINRLMKKKRQQNQKNIINMSYTNSDILNNNDKSAFGKAYRQYFLSFFDLCGSCFVQKRRPVNVTAVGEDNRERDSICDKKIISNNNSDVYDSGILINGTSTTTVTSSINGAEYIIVEEM
jgi:hypothetical protein